MSDISTDNSIQNFGSVQYKVVRNGAASKIAGRDIYTAMVITKETYGTKELAARMVSEGCAVKASTIRLVLSEFADLIGKLVAEGRSVNIGGVVRFFPGIRGTFDSIDSAWNATKNTIVVNAATGARMRTAAAASGVTRMDAAELPTLLQLIDVATSKPNVLTSQGQFFVSGERLTWDPAADDEGWFVSYDGTESKCSATEDVQDPTCASLIVGQTFDSAGEPVELYFRTRLGGEVLHQVKYEHAVETALQA